jgi:peptide/nickel transport system substrate-binding protein
VPRHRSAAGAAAGAKSRLVIAQSVDVQGLEPSNVNSRAESNIIGNMYAALYDVSETGEIKPYLAKSYKTSEDGKEMTFTLNEGLTCHDGEPLGRDVAHLQRAAGPPMPFWQHGWRFSTPSASKHVDSDLT